MRLREVAVLDAERLALKFVAIPLVIFWALGTAYLTGRGEVFLAAGINLVALLIICWFANPRAAIGILLIVRILLDAFHESISFTIAGFKSFSLPALAGIFLGVFGTLYLIQNSHVLRNRIVLPITLFLLAAVLSCFFSTDIGLSLVETIELYSFFVLLLVLVDIIKDEKELRFFSLLVIFSCFLPLIIGSLEILRHGRFIEVGLEPSFRAKSTLTHPTAFGFYLLTVSCLLLSIYRSVVSSVYRFGIICLLLVISVNVVFTFTRGVWVAFVTAVLIFSFLQYKKFLFLFPLLFYGIFQTIPYVYERIEPLFNSQQYKYTSFAWRTKLWTESIPFFYDNPVFGTGIGTYEFISRQISGKYMAAHNDYVRLLIETGLVGALSFTAILGSLLVLSLKAWRRAATEFQKSLSAGFISLLIAYLILSLTDNLFNNGAFQWYFWTFAAMVVASSRFGRDG